MTLLEWMNQMLQARKYGKQDNGSPKDVCVVIPGTREMCYVPWQKKIKDTNH